MTDLVHMSDAALTLHIEALYEQKMRLEVGGVYSYGGRTMLNRVDREWRRAQVERERRNIPSAAE